MQTILVKLGGSSVEPGSTNWKIKLRAFAEVLSKVRRASKVRILLGTGAGTRIHQRAETYGLRHGISNSLSYYGISDVHNEATKANQSLVDILIGLGVPAIQISPFCSFKAENGRPISCDSYGIQTLLEYGIMPVIYGDVVLDSKLGCTILSTESLLCFLAPILKASRTIIIGKEKGVYKDFGTKSETLVAQITKENYKDIMRHLRGSEKKRVTGGMDEKVKLLWELAMHGVEGEIIGDNLGLVKRSLLGEKGLGTRIIPP